jgi:hypothetical protein
MADAKGNLVPEMPGHGLTAHPATVKYPQITAVPAETYSNNVGLYGANSPIFVCFADARSACTSSGAGVGASPAGILKSVAMSINKRLLLDEPVDEPVKVVANLRAEGGAIGPVNVAYYDGNPSKDGQLFDPRKVAHMDPGVTYAHRAFFSSAELRGSHAVRPGLGR